MKKILILALCAFGVANAAKLSDFELRICKLYNEAGKARAEKKYGKAKFLEGQLSNLLDIQRVSISSCPKEYQEYGWKAEPRQYQSNGDRGRFLYD
ncbi:MAG: hypothetical protein MR481_01355 [Campylobacter sp.]|uniref:hypothetical protein n=1 Tax=Campylobacter sp. TaxID=205 RepID=UPI002AA672D8|nr:hypothetical protein [Campylobacter sp.]MCI7246562.1 hypothetical protein [Campylobacter sp.]